MSNNDLIFTTDGASTVIAAGDAKSRSRSKGFTLVEILIVVVILGILAAIIIPQFSNASALSRDNTLKDELRYLRTQLPVYAAQHQDVAPGYPGGVPGTTPDMADFTNQMTMFTDSKGNTNATYSSTFQFGPYLSQLPVNPVNSMSGITFVADNAPIPAPDGTSGFIYQPQTQTIIPNLVGKDTNGVLFSSY